MADIQHLSAAGRTPLSAAKRLANAATWRNLLSSDDPAGAFRAWLQLFCAQVDLSLGAVLGPGDFVRDGMIALGEPDSDRFSRVAAFRDDNAESLALAKSAERAMQTRRGVAQAPEGSVGSCQVAYPILIDGRLNGVIAVELVAAARDQLELAMRIAQWGSAWFNARFLGQSPVSGDAAVLQVECLRLFTSAQTAAVGAEAAATHLADRLKADRISIGLRRRASTRLLAMSHGGFASVINDYLAAVLAAMDEAADTMTRIAAPLDNADVAVPHAAHSRLCRVHECDWAESVPLALAWGRRQVKLVFVAEGKGPKPADLPQKLQAAAAAMAPVLIAQLRAEQPVLSRSLEWSGRSLAALRGHPLRAAMLVLAVAAAYFLAFAKAEYRVAADSKLEGVFRRSIVAPFDGYIVEAKARPGDKVAAGAELGRLDDRDLRLQRVDLEAKILEVSRQIDEAMGKREIAKVNILEARKEQHQADLKVVTENLARTVMTAPFAAYVVSGDKTQSIGSPVRRGDVLYEVAPLESFRVDLEIPQADFAAIQIGQTGRMLLTSMPYKTFAITVVRVTPIAAAHDGKTVFRAEAELEEVDPLLRPGMQGVARIEVGERHLVWIWTHTVVDWLRVKLWEWLP